MTDRTVERRKSTPQHRAEYAAAKAAPTEHSPRLVTSRQSRAVYGAGIIGQFNSRLAVLITRSVGAMWAAYSSSASRWSHSRRRDIPSPLDTVAGVF